MGVIKLPSSFLDGDIKIDLVGAGGNGSQMLYGLARLHFALRAVGHPAGLQVRLYDPDTVTEANIGRQSFSPADVGHLKAVILIHRINTFYGLNWQAVGARYREDNHYHTDIVVGCVDSAKSRREILSCLKRKWHAWWLDLGNAERSGQVVLGKYARIIDRRTAERDAQLARECRPPNVLELFPHLADEKFKEKNTPSCSVAESLTRQDLFINQTVASFALHLLWTWLRRGEIDHHGYFINLEAGQVNPMRIDPEAWQRLRANAEKPVKPKQPRKTRNASRKTRSKRP